MSIEAMKAARDYIRDVPPDAFFGALSRGTSALAKLNEAIAAAEKAEVFRFYVLGFGTYAVKEIAEHWAAEAGTEAIPLYTTPPDTAAMLAEKDALLRQVLEALEPFELSTSLAERTAEAIRNHLGVKND